MNTVDFDAFRHSIDPSNVLEIRKPEEVDGLSERGVAFLQSVQEQLTKMIKQPGGKSEAESFLNAQMEKFSGLEGEEATKVRTELFDYITATVWFTEV